MRRVQVVGGVLLLVLVVAQGTTPVPAQGQFGPTLARQGDHFTVNGVPTFLIFVSYFDALRANDWNADLNFLRDNGISGVRVLPNWWHYQCPPLRADDDSLIRRDGTLNDQTLQRLKDFLAAASARNLIVDVTFTRETLGDPLVDFATYRAGLQAATTALSAYRNVLFDVQNEWTKNKFDANDNTNRTLVVDLVNAVHARDAQRLVSGSTENPDAEAASFAAIASIDFAAHHDDRGTTWYDATGTVIGNVKAGLVASPKPIYLQEPMPYTMFCPTPEFDPDGSHHHTAARNARSAGGAAWTFHTRTAFSLSGTTYLQAASSAEEATIAGLRSVSNQACWGADAFSVNPPSASVASGGGSGSFAVQSNGTCNQSWSVASDQPWLSASPGSGSGNATVTYSVAPNTTPAARTGRLTIRGRTFTVTQPAPAVLGDFSNDGHPDLVWRNSSTNQNAFWWMNGRTMIATPQFLPVDPEPPAQSWKIRAVGDVTGDIHPDVIWQNDATGALAYWSFIGNQRQLTDSLNPSATPDDGDNNPTTWKWQIVGAADMNGNGKLDLVWRKSGTGELQIWYMDGKNRVGNPVNIVNSAGQALAAPDPWQVEGVGDMNGDGSADLVWRNSGTGHLAAWYLTNNVMSATPFLLDEKGVQIVMSDPSWRIVDVADIATDAGVRDGKPDLVWQRDGTTANNIAVWYMNGIQRTAGVYMVPPSMTDANWKMVGVK